jgi:hypothetical protein
MQKNRVRRRLHQFVLDGLFIALIAHFFITGAIVPHTLIALFRDQPQIVVVTEPVPDLQPGPESLPANEGGELSPET